MKRERNANISIPGDALINLPVGKFIACQYSLIGGLSTPTLVWSYKDISGNFKVGFFNFSGKYLGELENE
tara:strand:- start:731 stop:940 length:210 start_codon:yes stop_codon:yes gene_type:complete